MLNRVCQSPAHLHVPKHKTCNYRNHINFNRTLRENEIKTLINGPVRHM